MRGAWTELPLIALIFAMSFVLVLFSDDTPRGLIHYCLGILGSGAAGFFFRSWLKQ